MEMGIYLPIHEWLIFIKLVGKYTVRPMDPSWVVKQHQHVKSRKKVSVIDLRFCSI